jgi:Spy/CpxP family protein refolding chaperone
MPENFRVIEKLIDLLQDETAKDEEIRKKIDALQQARAKARKKLPEAKKKLAAVLTTPRQEAVFLLLGYID